jgi:DNA-binding SARP family transcriptional activator/uncharacterized membrane protein YgcG
VSRGRGRSAAAGLGALLILLALIAGLPVLLYRLGGSPLPGHLPAAAQVGHALLHRDSASVVLSAVRDVTWIAWALFTLAVLAEVQAVLRRRTAPRLWLGGMQTAAARLVALAALTFSAAPAATLLATPQPVSTVLEADVTAMPTSHFTVAARLSPQAPPAAAPGAAEPVVPRTAAGTPPWAPATGRPEIQPGPAIAPPLPGPPPAAVSLGAGWAGGGWAGGGGDSGGGDSGGGDSGGGDSGPAAAAPRVETAAVFTPAAPDSQAGSAREDGMGIIHLVTVRPGDCLWTIAQQHLGSGERFHEIVALNLGHDMGNGQVFTNPSLIQPGWVLHLPAAAVPLPGGGGPPGRGTPPPAPGGGTHSGHPVSSPPFSSPHPSASAAPVTTPSASPSAQPSASVTGAPSAPVAPSSAPASAPAAPSAAAASSASASAAASAPAAASSPAASSPAASSPAASSPAASAPAVPPGPRPTAPGGGPSGPPGAQAGQATPVSSVASVSPARDTRLPIGIAFGTGVLAGGAAASLARLRHRQRQARRRGRRIPVPASAPVAVAEQRLNVAAAQESMTALRGVLSHLAAALVATPQQMPEIAALLVQPDLLEVLLASPAAEPPPPPFTVAGGRQGKAWQLWLDDEPPNPAGEAGDLVPGLLTIGASGGGYLLADLEHLQVTTVDGPAGMTAAVLRSAAAELATGQLAGWYDLILVGFPELAALGGRGSCCDSLDAGLDLLTAKAVALRRRLGESPAADVRYHRLVDPDDEDWALTLLVSSVPPTSGQLALLSDLAAEPGGIAALVPGGAEPSGGHRLPATISLSAGPVGSDFIVARLWPLQLEARPQSLGDADYEALTSLFVTAAEAHDLSPSDPPYDGWLWPPDLAAGGSPDGGDLDGGDLDGGDLPGDDPGDGAAALGDGAFEYGDDDESGGGFAGGGFADDGSGAGGGSPADEGSGVARGADYPGDDGPAVLDGWPGEDEWAAEPVVVGDTWAAPNWAGEPGWAPDPGWAADPAVLTAVPGRNGAGSGDAASDLAGLGGDGAGDLPTTERGDAVTAPEAAEGWAEVGGLEAADWDDAGGPGAAGLDEAGGLGAAGLDEAGGLGAAGLDEAGGLGAADPNEAGGLDAAASWSDLGEAGAQAGWPGEADQQEEAGWAQDPAVTGLPGAPAAWLSEPPADPPDQAADPLSDPVREARPDAPEAPGSASPAESAAAAADPAAAPDVPGSAAPAAPAVQESLRIGVLGTFTINGQPGALLPAQSQLVLALALNGTSGLSNQQLCYLLGADPDRPKPSDSLRQLIVRTRRQLGRAPDRREWIEHLGGGQYALHPLARFDWHEFDALATEGMRSRDARRLRRALGLIRGRPFTGCYYWWLDLALTETVRAQIVDAADVLAALELAGRDPAAAARAARIGLAGDAGAEQLWRALMRAEHAAGNLSGVREAWSRCLDAISEIAPDGEPHPGTAAVYRELLGDAPAHPAWAGGGRPG